MKKLTLLVSIVMIITSYDLTGTKNDEIKTIDKSVLPNKIAGGWAGKIIGVTYGDPTEFRTQGKTYEKPIICAGGEIEKDRNFRYPSFC